MTLTEIRGNLFAAPNDCFFAHCISGDYALGAGIAKSFNEKFDMRKKLRMMYPVGSVSANGYRSYMGRALLVDNTFNLVTKERYWMKPIYQTLRHSLEDMKRQCVSLRIKKVAMPRIGCGLDQCNWEYVKQIIFDVFKDTDVEITVYYL